MSNAIKQGAVTTATNTMEPGLENQEVMTADTTPKSGLCAICDNSETCTFPRAGFVVHHCDELDHSGDRSWQESNPGQLRIVNASVPVQEVKAGLADSEFLGLCATCENRTECVFPKPESGVWSCDEFV